MRGLFRWMKCVTYNQRRQLVADLVPHWQRRAEATSPLPTQRTCAWRTAFFLFPYLQVVVWAIAVSLSENHRYTYLLALILTAIAIEYLMVRLDRSRWDAYVRCAPYGKNTDRRLAGNIFNHLNSPLIRYLRILPYALHIAFTLYLFFWRTVTNQTPLTADSIGHPDRMTFTGIALITSAHTLMVLLWNNLYYAPLNLTELKSLEESGWGIDDTSEEPDSSARVNSK